MLSAGKAEACPISHQADFVKTLSIVTAMISTISVSL
jgi:hypothetical protein